jgi:PAS domain S-box-containing protein
MNDSRKTKSELLHELQRVRARVVQLEETRSDEDEDGKRVEAALRKSEELNRLTLENISDAVFIVDDSERFTYICPNVDVIFGYSVDEVRAMDNIAELLGSQLVDLEELKTSGEVSNIERQISDKVGRKHDLLVNVKRVAIEDGTGLYSCRDVTDRKRAEDALRLEQEELRKLTAQLVGAREDERKHLARELHDGVSQRMAVLALEVARLLQDGSTFPGRARESLQGIQQGIGDLADDCHQLSRRLHPSILYDLGLRASLESECTAFSKQYDISTKFIAEDVPASIPEDVQLCIYRVVQESLQNVARHAEADEVLVTLTGREKRLTLSVSDNGKGFDSAQVRGRGGLGLVSVKERVRLVNGKFSVRSQPGDGTELEVRVPLDD